VDAYNEGYLSTAEVAAILRFKPRTIRAMCATGELPAIQVRGEYRIKRSDLEKWLESRKINP
jgi:excisionase family DNA binding protein